MLLTAATTSVSSLNRQRVAAGQQPRAAGEGVGDVGGGFVEALPVDERAEGGGRIGVRSGDEFAGPVGEPLREGSGRPRSNR